MTVDFLAHGVSRWPEKSRLDKAMRYFSVYLASIQDDDDKLVELLDAFANWHRPGFGFSFVLDIVGLFFLKQARPAAFADDDESYRQLLVARTLVRVSNASEADVVRVVEYLASINGGSGDYNVTSGPPEHWTIDFFDVVLTPQWLELYTRLLFDTIGAVDSFTLNVNNNGVGVYDSEDQLYDDALYS